MVPFILKFCKVPADMLSIFRTSADLRYFLFWLFLTGFKASRTSCLKLLNSSLDTKINEIKESIEEAENLKNDTQVTLSEIKKRQNEVELEIKEIHLNSKNKIKILESQAQIRLSGLYKC